MKKALWLLIVIPQFLSCSGQNKALDKGAADLEAFDFLTPITTLLPESTRDKNNKERYRIKSTILSADTAYDDRYDEHRKATWLEYREQQFEYGDAIAKFGAQDFNTVNIVTTVAGEVMLMNGVAGRVSPEEIKAFLAAMNKKYGQAVKSQGEFMKPYDIYTWTLKDRIVKYVPLYDDESNTLKIEVDKDKGTLQGGDKEGHYQVLLYVIKKEYATQLTGNLHSGDLLYCN